jgi:cellulose synthase/poly-beta-1,6-N-acetylglucosamine synthase-like glycosyltransferase
MMQLLCGVMVALSCVLFVVAATTVWWMLHAWRDPDTLGTTAFRYDPEDAAHPAHTISLLVPARHEERVLADTLEQLCRLDHPAVEVIVIVGHDDDATRTVAESVARRHPDLVQVVVDDNWPKSKPKALNTGLPHCRGTLVGIFDAEDEVHAQLLRVVDAAFSSTGADVVQGGVQLVNFRSSWYALRNCLEYFFWFRSRLHLHARHHFIPLGGNTVFFRTDLLRAVGGYDPDCLAEDCEIGVRLSTLGAKLVVSYDPYLVTREETPDTVRSLVRQRTRWNQGFLQVLTKGVWRRLPGRRQRLLARYTLAQPFLQAVASILVPVAIVTAVSLKLPVGVAMISFLPAIPTAAMVLFELVGLREFCRVYYIRPSLPDYSRLLAGTLAYHALLAWAAARAVLRHARGQRGWEKTAHSNAHRAPTALATTNGPGELRPTVQA